MTLIINIAALTLFTLAVCLVLSWHWEEVYGDNHY